MFIIGKKEDKVDEGLRNCLGANNINIIYDYFDSYYSVMHQQDEINDCKRQYNNASNRYYNACFTCWGALGFLLNYPKYNNYDGLEVPVTDGIPSDYKPCWYDCQRSITCSYALTEGKDNNYSCEKKCNGIMGVPITWLDKYNPGMFEIIKFRKGDDGKDLCVNKKCPYFRILIRLCK
jgi:hypothetical protein